ncbi:MAG: hypothetical protein ACYC8V_06175 [Caulobacteraceae bacterium]
MLIGQLIVSAAGAAMVWAVAFVWMGLGCVLNALRCHRLHCYISGPLLLVGAALLALLGAGVLSLGSHGVNLVTASTAVLVALSFAPEAICRRYPAR